MANVRPVSQGRTTVRAFRSKPRLLAAAARRQAAQPLRAPAFLMCCRISSSSACAFLSLGSTRFSYSRCR